MSVMYLTGKMSCFVLIVVVFVHVTNTLAQTVFPEAKCFEKPIPEDASLSCDCTGNGTEKDAQLPGSSFSWPGYSNTSALRLNNIRRELNGTVFVCLMQVAGEENRTANYTLQVVFGPSDDNTTVMGPSTFITDGSRDLNLTCTVTDAHPPPRISWSSPFTCDTPDSHICVFKPRVPEDDGKGVVCIATNPVFPPVKAAWAYYFLNLSYPPQTEPEISANLPTEVLRSGNTVTCTVAGGKPLVSSVIFTCTNPTLSDRDDVIGETSVSSSVVIDTSLATANVTVCTCSAVWDTDPQLYANTSEAELLLEYQATVNKFTVNSTNDLSVLEDDKSSAVFQCDVTGRSSARVSMRKRGSWTSVGNTEDVTSNETDSVQRTLVHTYTVTSATCEDMGTYTCTAESGFGDIISDSVRLTVSCGPRLFNGSTDPPPLLTTSGLQLYLVAHPLPERVSYSFTYNASVTLTEDDRILRVDCQKHIDQRHLVVCSLKRDEIRKDYFGVYSVSIANALGAFQFRVNVNDEDEALISQATARLIAGLLAAAILVVVVVIIIFIVRERNAKKLRSNQQDDNNEDVEATGDASRSSTTTSPDSDPSIPFREVTQPSHPSHPKRSRSETTLAEVVPRTTDVIFAVAEPKPFDFGELPAYREEKGDTAAESVATSTGFAEDSTLYETGYMSVDLTPRARLSPTGNQSRSKNSAGYEECESGFNTQKSGSGFALETKQRTFITKIFLPQQSPGKDSSADHDKDEAYSSRDYAQVNKVRKTDQAPARQQDTGTSVEEEALENAFKLDDFDLDDREEEKMASLDLEDEDDDESESSGMDENDPYFGEMYEVKSDTESVAKQDRGTDSMKWRAQNSQNEQKLKTSSDKETPRKASGEGKSQTTESETPRIKTGTFKKSDLHDKKEGTIDKKKHTAEDSKATKSKGDKGKQHTKSAPEEKTPHKSKHDQREKTETAKGDNSEAADKGGEWRPEPKKRKKLKLLAKKKKHQETYEVEKSHIQETDGSEAELINTL